MYLKYAKDHGKTALCTGSRHIRDTGKNFLRPINSPLAKPLSPPQPFGEPVVRMTVDGDLADEPSSPTGNITQEVAMVSRIILSLLAFPSLSYAQSLTITVNPNAVERVIPAHFHGVNLMGTALDMYAVSDDTRTALQNAGFAGFRFPGGIPTDTYYWDCPYYIMDSAYLASGQDPCPSQVTDVIDGVPRSHWSHYNAGPQHYSSRLLLGPSYANEPYIYLIKNWADGNPFWYYSMGRLSPQEADTFAQQVNPYGYRMLYQTNVFGTLDTQANISYPPGRSPTPAYAYHWMSDVGNRGIEADFEVGNEPEHFVIENDGDWNWAQDYFDAFASHALMVRWSNTSEGRSARVFGPATNIGSSSYYTSPQSQCSTGQEAGCSNMRDTSILGQDNLPLGYRGNSEDTIGWRVLDNFLRQMSGKPFNQQPDGISIHYYPGNQTSLNGIYPPGSSPTPDSWAHQRSAAQAFTYAYDRVQALMQHWLGVSLPVMVSEWHSGLPNSNRDGTGQNHSVASALQQLDTVATFAQVGVEAHHFFSVHNVGPSLPFWKDTDCCTEGLTYQEVEDGVCVDISRGQVCTDHRFKNENPHSFGMLTGFTDQHGTLNGGDDIHDQAGRYPDEPSPTYYAMAMWGAHMGNRMLAPPSRSGPYNDGEISTYATKTSDGNIQVLAINKTDESVNLRVNFSDSAYKVYSQGSWTRISAPSGNNDYTIITEDELQIMGHTPPVTQLYLPPLVQTLGDGYGINRQLPPYSATIIEMDPTQRPSNTGGGGRGGRGTR